MAVINETEISGKQKPAKIHSKSWENVRITRSRPLTAMSSMRKTSTSNSRLKSEFIESEYGYKSTQATSYGNFMHATPSQKVTSGILINKNSKQSFVDDCITLTDLIKQKESEV